MPWYGSRSAWWSPSSPWRRHCSTDWPTRWASSTRRTSSTVLASLFLLVVCVQLSWEIGRLEDKSRSLAEEVALLRKDIDDLGALDGSARDGF